MFERPAENLPVPYARTGRVVQAPTSADDEVHVVLHWFSETQRYVVERWAPRFPQLPQNGDECLVVLDEEHNPWMIAYWSIGGNYAGVEMPAGGDLTGFYPDPLLDLTDDGGLAHTGSVGIKLATTPGLELTSAGLAALLKPGGGLGKDSGGIYAATATEINVKAPPYSATGDGTTNDYTAINSAMSAASAAGGGSVYFPTGLYKFATQLAVPAGVTLRLGANAKLYCTVTGGVDGIKLGENAGIVGEGGHGNVTSSPPQGFCGVVSADSAVIDALVATSDGISQVHIRDVFLLTSGGGAGTANSVLDLRGMDGGFPYVQGVLCHAASHAKNGLRIRAKTGHSAEETALDKVWILSATEDAVKIEANSGGPGVVNVSLTNFVVVGWGDGFSGVKIDGHLWEAKNVYLRNFHLEQTASVSTATQAILADTVRHCTFENLYFNATNPTNKTLIKLQQTTTPFTWANAGNAIRNIKASVSLTNLVNDAERSVTRGGEWLAAYHQESVPVRTKAGIPSDSDFVYTPPVGTPVLDTSNNRIYWRTGSNVWKYSALT